MSAFLKLHPVEISAAADALAPLLTGAGMVPLEAIAWLRVTGPDRVRWLNGMVTNSIQALKPGQGCYNYLLNAQGRIQADCTAFAVEGAILLETGRSQIAGLIAMLDRYIIMDDVELTELEPNNRSGILIAGPGANSVLAHLDLAAHQSDSHLEQVLWKGQPVDFIHAHSPLVPQYEIWSDADTLSRLTEDLLEFGTRWSTPEAMNQLRLLEGTPLYGIDITDRDLPQETALPNTQSRALHFSKGCYLGQEIVERIRSRGQVHRTLSGFILTGELPPPGTALNADEKQQLTSVAAVPLPSGTVQLALGYVRREALERGTPLLYPGGAATPISLPYTATSA